MPARDTFHDVVVEALQKDGWTITHDPFRLGFEGKRLYADLGAERPIAAERGTEKILVEIKSFVGLSDVTALANAIGQYQLYKILLEEAEKDRTPFLAIPSEAFRSAAKWSNWPEDHRETRIEIVRLLNLGTGDRTMVAVTDYPRILQNIIEEYAKHPLSVGEATMEIIIDEPKGHYELMETGWIKERRVHGSILHFDILGDKIWIQFDGTQDGVANELVAAGVPKDKIVLAYKSPAMRPYTEFAVN